MLVNWEALASIASLLSTVAVLAALIVGVRQLRVGAAQVEHLRRATQLEGTMKIFGMLASGEQIRARRFISMELPERMKDPQFRAEISMLSYAPSLHDHHELEFMRLMEMIGVYVKYGLLDADIVFDHWIPAVIKGWEDLDKVGIVAMHRAATDDAMWENFEDLYRRALVWYPPHLARMKNDRAPAPAGRPVQSEVAADASSG